MAGTYNKGMYLSLASRGGYAALMTLLVVLGASLTLIGSFTFFSLNEVRINRGFIKAIEARTAAESGVEDVAYRLVSGKQTSASDTLAVGNAVTETTLTQNGGQRIIRAEGNRDDYRQSMETRIDVTTDSVSFFYGVHVDVGGVTMGNGAQVSGNADHLFATASSNRDIAQSFTANATGPLTKVSVFLGKNGAPTADLNVRITTDVGGRPDTSAISNGTAVILRSSVGGTPSWIDVTFATSPNIINGTKYWIVLDYSTNSATHHWNWRKDNTDGYTGQTGKYTANWSAGSPTWTNVGGDLVFRVWIGGINTSLSDTTVDGTARAPAFDDVSAGGSACPNPSCIVANDPPQGLPISEGIIQEWKDDAAAGGTITGNYAVSSDVSLGPKKITGDLDLTANNKTLTVTGTIYVQGNMSIGNGSMVRCDPSYASNSCVILNDGWVHTRNNGVFSGSGSAGSYVMLLSTSACDGASTSPPCDTAHHNAAIDLHNNADGAIFYAGHGLINVHNNVTVSELTAYRITLDNSATVTYEAGLQNLQFTSGRSGGYEIKHWKETE